MLGPDQRLLDVGCGWGSLALHAALHYGAEVVGITLSEPQADFARERAAEVGLEHRVRSRSPTIASCRPGGSTRSPASACSSTSARHS